MSIDAAVFILIYKKSIIFIKRNKNLKIHPGEISFPGGKFSFKKDKTLLDTAYRETEEELGIDKEKIKLIDKMPPFKTLVTNINVTPFIGKIIYSNIKFNINKYEVEEVLIIPINHLLQNKSKVIVPLKVNGKIYPNTFYYFKNNLIWGATSRILDEFLRDKDTLNQLLA